LRVRNFRTFDNSNQALTYIAGRLSLASAVRNTRIVAHNLTRPEDFAGQERDSYEDGVRKLIERGAFVHDVVTKHWEANAIELAKLRNAKNYRCRVLRQDLPPWHEDLYIQGTASTGRNPSTGRAGMIFKQRTTNDE
jgi:hypothetical protein